MCQDVFQTLSVNSHVTLFFLMRVCISQTKITCTESVPVKLFSVWASSVGFLTVFFFFVKDQNEYICTAERYFGKYKCMC